VNERSWILASLVVENQSWPSGPNPIVDGSSIKHGKKLKNPGFVGETAAK